MLSKYECMPFSFVDYCDPLSHLLALCKCLIVSCKYGGMCDSYLTHISFLLEQEVLKRSGCVLFTSSHHHSNLLPWQKLGAYPNPNDCWSVTQARADHDYIVISLSIYNS